MLRSLLKYTTLLFLIFSIPNFASAYEFDNQGRPIPYEYWWWVALDDSAYGLAHQPGSDYKSDLEAALVVYARSWNEINCNSRDRSCLKGPLSYQIVSTDLYQSIAYGNILRRWTANYELSRFDYTINTEVIEDWTVTGESRGFLECPKPWRMIQYVDGREFPWFCTIPNDFGFCPAGYRYNADSGPNKCIAQCATGAVWNDSLKYCEQLPRQETCETSSKNPIDFITGRKYRSEDVITVGARSSLTLSYFYDSKLEGIPTAAGEITPYLNTYAARADSVPSHTYDEYIEKYNAQGMLKTDPTVNPQQFYGHILDYWRHNFDDVLLVRGNTFIFHAANGQQYRFNGFGYSGAYPNISISPLLGNAEGFDGYVISNSSERSAKYFDKTGRLRKITYKNNESIFLEYANGLLHMVRSSNGDWLEFSEYLDIDDDWIYEHKWGRKYYPKVVKSSDGRKVELVWGQAAKNDVGTAYLLTKVSVPYDSSSSRIREFSYLSATSALMTGIFDIDSSSGQRRQYARFDYDSQRRAVLSELSGGFERINIGYLGDFNRVVTNALGLSTNYGFADVNGVRRLTSISGEATINCAATETNYTYFPNGNVETMEKNGLSTRFSYNSRNLVEKEIIAEGTEAERVVTTCWHPTLDLPERIISEAGIRTYIYDSRGRVVEVSDEPAASSNSTCENN